MAQTQFEKPENINPILAYLGFTRRSVFTKKSVIICFAIFTLIAFLIGIIPSAIMYNLLSMNSSSPDAYTSWFQFTSQFKLVESSIIAFTAGLIGVLVFLTMFKDGESDGTELITVSKPISRKQILWSRYIFAIIIAISMALINEILFGISYAILNGVTDGLLKTMFYPLYGYQCGPAYFGGMFGGTILSFFIFGLISAALSIKASGKTTRILSMLIMFGSVGIANVTSNTLPMLVGNPVTTSLTNSANNLLEGFVGKTMEEINTEYRQTIESLNRRNDEELLGGNSSTYPNRFESNIFGDNSRSSSSSSSYTSKYDEYKNLKISSINKSDNYYLNSMYSIGYEPGAPIESQFGSYTITFSGSSSSSSSGNYNNDFQFSEFLLNGGYQFNLLVINNMGNSSPASGAVALSYLNPMSAMQGMMSSALPASSYNSVPYNWSLSNFIAITGSNNGSESSSSVVFKDHAIADPAWGLMLTWIAVCGILGALTTVGYLRKDFK